MQLKLSQPGLCLVACEYNRNAMNAPSPTFYLFWLRESGCDAGSPVTAAELPASIQDRILQLAGSASCLQLRLPYLNRIEERHAEDALAGVAFERTGDLIRAVLDPAAATRDMAATCALTDQVWRGAPGENNPQYFAAWQRVSLHLQRWLRDAFASAYFQDLSRLEDRAATYPVIVYQAARLYYGRPRSDFAYDLRDFPWCKDTLETSWKLTGRHMQRVMTELEARLRQAGQETLARRYSPVWHQDVMVAVQRKPKPYVDLLARESAIINAVIDLGAQPKPETIQRSAGTVNRQLRRVLGMDLRSLGCSVFEEATKALTQRVQGGLGDQGDIWPIEHPDVLAAGRPDARIGG